jgi:hypothetical protein
MATDGQPKMTGTNVSPKALQPALASIPDACRYLGGLSRAKFYRDILLHLETVHLGTRHFVVVASLDRFIAERATVQDAKSAPDTSEAAE